MPCFEINLGYRLFCRPTGLTLFHEQIGRLVTAKVNHYFLENNTRMTRLKLQLVSTATANWQLYDLFDHPTSYGWIEL